MSVGVRKSRGHPEDALQVQCVNWFRAQYTEPRAIIFAIPNGGKRNAKEAARLKAGGVRSGVFDLQIIGQLKETNQHCMFVELKIKPNKLTDNQKEFKRIAEIHGVPVEVCYSFDEFEKLCHKYLGNRVVRRSQKNDTV